MRHAPAGDKQHGDVKPRERLTRSVKTLTPALGCLLLSQPRAGFLFCAATRCSRGAGDSMSPRLSRYYTGERIGREGSAGNRELFSASGRSLTPTPPRSTRCAAKSQRHTVCGPIPSTFA